MKTTIFRLTLFLIVLAGCPNNQVEKVVPETPVGVSRLPVIRKPVKYVEFDNDHVKCARSEECIADGRCSYHDSKCMDPVLLSNDELLKPFLVEGSCRDACAHSGQCASTEKGCEARNDDDCAQSVDCRELGACEALDGYCVAKTDGACQNSSVCWNEGACRASGGLCVPLTNDDCRGPEHRRDHFYSPCRWDGACEVVDERCQAASCDEPCRIDGRCELVSRRTIGSRGAQTITVCEIGENLDCSNTRDCSEKGECEVGLVNIYTTRRRKTKGCVVSESGCQNSLACRSEGHCKAMPIRHGIPARHGDQWCSSEENELRLQLRVDLWEGWMNVRKNRYSKSNGASSSDFN